MNLQVRTVILSKRRLQEASFWTFVSLFWYGLVTWCNPDLICCNSDLTWCKPYLTWCNLVQPRSNLMQPRSNLVQPRCNLLQPRFARILMKKHGDSIWVHDFFSPDAIVGSLDFSNRFFLGKNGRKFLRRFSGFWSFPRFWSKSVVECHFLESLVEEIP